MRSPIVAQHHEHGMGAAAERTATTERPRIFLDKSPRVVQYQLQRLSNDRLLLVERNVGDAKYIPVYMAILTRAGMSTQHREEALAGLVAIKKSNVAAELLQVLAEIKVEDSPSRQTARQLAAMLLELPDPVLIRHAGDFINATDSTSAQLRAVGYAGLIVSGQGDQAWQRAARGENSKLDWVNAVPLVPHAAMRSTLHEPLQGLVAESHSTAVRVAAIEALASVPSRPEETFELLAPLVAVPELRAAAIHTLSRIPTEHRPSEPSSRIVDALLEHAAETPAEHRTSDSFIDGMQLADQLLARLPFDRARSYRQRLREISVRVVLIRTVAEEMRYDTPFFAVEVGSVVQVILKNEDLMPHNLVLTTPGDLRAVAELGQEAGPNHGYLGKQYVPASDKVLHATDMVQPGEQFRLTFTAPSQVGEYPYVCTFPLHWMRMYGVMVVVDDLDAWLEHPEPPKDPIGSNRTLVKNWQVDDLSRELAAGMRGRSLEIGRRIFHEATCAQCHRSHGEGGTVGPELTNVLNRWQGDRVALLREILEPSYRIDPKYAVHVIVTDAGQSISGIISSQDEKVVSVLVNPESQELTVVQRSEIEELVTTSTSMMPKGLLDRFTKDEIFELLAYIASAQGTPE